MLTEGNLKKPLPKTEVMTKYYSVMCNCGHRIYFKRNDKDRICKICGVKHLSPKELFKLRLKAYLKNNGSSVD